MREKRKKKRSSEASTCEPPKRISHADFEGKMSDEVVFEEARTWWNLIVCMRVRTGEWAEHMGTFIIIIIRHAVYLSLSLWSSHFLWHGAHIELSHRSLTSFDRDYNTLYIYFFSSSLHSENEVRSGILILFIYMYIFTWFFFSQLYMRLLIFIIHSLGSIWLWLLRWCCVVWMEGCLLPRARYDLRLHN